MMVVVNKTIVAAAAKPAGSGRADVSSYSALFRALGDETRLEIVGLLASARGALCVCEIEPRFDLSQPTISHHLRVLREAGVVLSTRRGTWVHYAIDPRASEAIERFLVILTRRGNERSAP